MSAARRECWAPPTPTSVNLDRLSLDKTHLTRFVLFATRPDEVCFWEETKMIIVVNSLNHHHHHVALPARISLTLSCHTSLSSIASSRSSRLQSYCMQVLAGRSAFARPCERAHRSTSLMSSTLLLHQYPACLVCLTWIVFLMGGRWPYSCCFVGCCLQDLFNIARSILV